MLLSRQAAVPSYRLRHRRATRGASARRGATIRIPFTDWTVGVSHGGSPPKPPKQERGAAEGDGDEKAQGWWQTAIEAGPALGTVAAGVGILVWHASLATKADFKELKDAMITKVDLNLALMQTKDSLKTEMKADVKEIKDSLKSVVTWPYLVGAVVIAVTFLFVGKSIK